VSHREAGIQSGDRLACPTPVCGSGVSGRNATISHEDQRERVMMSSRDQGRTFVVEHVSRSITVDRRMMPIRRANPSRPAAGDGTI